MGALHGIAVVGLLASAGCLKDSLITCGDQLCPPSSICMIDHCVLPASLTPCKGLPDGNACVTDNEMSGFCQTEVCIPVGCGNGVVEPGEVCDDGNNTSGDGCSADCLVVDTCPPIGTTPRYATTQHETTVGECDYYTESAAADAALAICGPAIAFGAPDLPLASLSTFSAANYLKPHLTPEGDGFIVIYQGDGSSSFVPTNPLSSFLLETYQSDHAGGWQLGPTIQLTVDSLSIVGVPSRGPTRRMMSLTTIAQMNILAESSVDPTGTVTPVKGYGVSQLGATPTSSGNLSPDGLRLVFGGSSSGAGPTVFYTDRPSLDAPFRVAEPLVGLPAVGVEAFMTADCSRVYFSELGVQYVEQL